MSSYEYLILDVDDTLLDFEESELNAFRRTMEVCKIVADGRLQNRFCEISDDVWLEYRLDDVQDPFIQKNYHESCRCYAVERFVRLEKEVGTGMSPERLSSLFLQMYKEEFCPEPDALEICRILSKYFRLVIATNGLAEIQRCRISAFENYCTQIFVSEDVGAIKPSKAFFDFIIKKLKVNDPSSCLMVGDSMSTDMTGAAEAGMDTCWYNRRNKVSDYPVKPTYEIGRLSDLLEIIRVYLCRRRHNFPVSGSASGRTGNYRERIT